MDFFKSVFADDPDPSDPNKQHTSPPQSPKNQENPDEPSTLQDPPSNPNPNPESSSSSSIEGVVGAWKFGGLIKTLASRSESVIQTYRRDLEEFGSGLKKETEAIREAASRAVKELPASIEVGASVAQESLESVGNVIDEFGNSVWRGTSEIISNSKESILSADAESDSSDSQYYFRTSNSKPYSRFEMQVASIQSDLATFSEEPDDLNDYSKWKSGFVLEEKKDEITDLVGENGVMEEVYFKIVPSVVDHETFWSRYFYRVYKLKQAEDARAILVKRAISGDDEDLSWDVDDDDNNADEAKTEKKDSAEVVTDKQSENVVDSKNTDKNLSPTPAAAPVVESGSNDSIQSEKIVSSSELNKELAPKSEEKISELAPKSEEKISPTEKDGKGESSKGSEQPVAASKPGTEEEDIGWDEIEEDVGSSVEKKVSVGGSPNRPGVRKQLSTVEDEEDLSWDIEDDDEPVKR